MDSFMLHKQEFDKCSVMSADGEGNDRERGLVVKVWRSYCTYYVGDGLKEDAISTGLITHVYMLPY